MANPKEESRSLKARISRQRGGMPKECQCGHWQREDVPEILELVLTRFSAAQQRNAHVVTIDDYEDVPSNCERDLQKAVAMQPVSVAIEADKRDFQFYSSVSGQEEADCRKWRQAG